MEALSDRPVTYVDDDEVIAEGGNEDDERFGYCYYRLATGWIVQGRADPSSVETYKRKGCTPLVEEYGRHVMNPAIIRDRKGNTLPQWNPYAQPYDKLLLEAPHEFPVEQVIAHHWHRGVRAQWIEYLPDGRYRTHRKTVTFPQLAGIDVPEFPCTICGRVLMSTVELNTHTRVAHPEQGTILELAKTQRAIADAIGASKNGGGNDAGLAVLEQIVATQTQMGEIIAELLRRRGGRPPGSGVLPRPTRTIRDDKGHYLGSERLSDEEVAAMEEIDDDGTDSPAPHERGGPDSGGDEAELRDPAGPVAPA